MKTLNLILLNSTQDWDVSCSWIYIYIYIYPYHGLASWNNREASRPKRQPTRSWLIIKARAVAATATEGLLRTWWNSIAVSPVHFVLGSSPASFSKKENNMVGGENPGVTVLSLDESTAMINVTDTKFSSNSRWNASLVLICFDDQQYGPE